MAAARRYVQVCRVKTMIIYPAAFCTMVLA